MKFDNKELKASFELDDGITQLQLETYEFTTLETLRQYDDATDAVVYRAHLTGLLDGGFMKHGEGVPKTVDQIDETSVKVINWMAVEIESFIKDIKYIDPNLLRKPLSPEKESETNPDNLSTD